MIAVDTSVLIDLLGDDPQADTAEAALRLALSSGPVVVCDVVLTELTAGLGHGSEVMDALEEMGLTFSNIDQRAAIRAGEMQRKYKQRLATKAEEAGSTPSLPSPRTIPDFLVGAHAMLQCDGLISRDQGFFRDYFKGLRVIVPSAS